VDAWDELDHEGNANPGCRLYFFVPYEGFGADGPGEDLGLVTPARHFEEIAMGAAEVTA